MKFLFFILIILPTITLAQTETEEICDSLFSLSIDHVEAEDLAAAILLWEDIVENYPDSLSCFKNSLNNLPIGYERLEDYEAAKKWTKKILETELNNFDQGSDIMEPYANYDHNACMQMARILYKEEKFEEGLEYLNLAESKYRYETFSATSFEKRAVSIALWKSDFYLKMDQKEKAIWVLVHKAIDVDVFYRKPDWSGFTNVNFYNEVVAQALALIDETYGFDTFKMSFFEAIKNIKVKKEFIIKGGKKTSAKSGTFELLGQSYFLGASDKKFNRKKFQKRILQTLFVMKLKASKSEKS